MPTVPDDLSRGRPRGRALTISAALAARNGYWLDRADTWELEARVLLPPGLGPKAHGDFEFTLHRPAAPAVPAPAVPALAAPSELPVRTAWSAPLGA
ncbi:hypothetical protein [Kitasatospora cheerisanensis]|uniref:Uncharacterized protein n=1 Tax=Kitasatospora cheerisanensis KCTC 2395 TaxID=1348663 RepID=A0A066Z2U1_9ACTN|nr:hypothetical protein [Kitasatospora cheerisanensis]KDN88093.1 hypothetical protein KCH_01700 [Kitasatospora cheerisanensis KCTC 2395]